MAFAEFCDSLNVPKVEADYPIYKRIAVFRSYYQHFFLASAETEPWCAYNPDNEKNRNNAIDMLQLPALSLPAYVLFEDRKFLGRIREWGLPQGEWVMTPTEFVERWRQGTLPLLEFDSNPAADASTEQRASAAGLSPTSGPPLRE